MKGLHIAGIVIAALLAVWAIYVVATKKEGESYSGMALRFATAGMYLNNHPPENAEHKGLIPGVGRGGGGPATAAPKEL
jgi:hypothetical protein